MNLSNKRILVTGGSGFLGGHVIARLRATGCKQIIAPRSAEYDLTVESDVLLHAIVPMDASTGPIAVHTPHGTHQSTTLFYLPPVIDSFSPNAGWVGSTTVP